MRGHGSQWFSHKMNNRHPLQLKKSKSWEPFGSYQLNSTANPAHLPQNRPNFEVNGLDWQCCLAGSSQRAPRIFIFSIVLGAECLSYLKSIETHARAFSRLISDGISGVTRKEKKIVKMVRLVTFKKENRKSQVSSESHADYNDDHELNSERC